VTNAHRAHGHVVHAWALLVSGEGRGGAGAVVVKTLQWFGVSCCACVGVAGNQRRKGRRGRCYCRDPAIVWCVMLCVRGRCLYAEKEGEEQALRP